MKKQFAVILLAAMLANLSACGSGATVAESTTAGQNTDSAVTTAPAEYQKPNVDYKGAEVPVVVYNNTTSNWKLTDYNMMIQEENGDIINDAIVKTNRMVEEDLNVDLKLSEIKYEAANTITALTNAILAGDDEFKFAMVMTCAMSTLLAQPDMLVDLATVSTLDLSHSWWDENSVEEYNLFGKQYAVCGDICLNMKGSPICYFFDKKIIEDLKLESPYDMVYDGTWTIDNMIKLAEAAQSDLNGDTKVDKGDRFGITAEPSTLTYSLYGAGIRYSTKNDNSVKLSLNTQNTTNVIEKIVALLNNESVCMLSSKWQAGYTSVFTELMFPTFTEDRVLFYSNQLLVALNLRDMNADFGIVPAPKYDEKQTEYYAAANTWWRDNVIIPATNTDLEMTGNVIEAMGYYAQQYVTPAFVDQTVLGKTIRDDDSAYMVNLLFHSQVYDIATIFNWGKIVDKVNAMPGNNDTGFASMYASVEPAAIEAMEKTIAQFTE